MYKSLGFTVNFDKGEIWQTKTIAKAEIRTCLRNGYYWTACSLKKNEKGHFSISPPSSSSDSSSGSTSVQQKLCKFNDHNSNTLLVAMSLTDLCVWIVSSCSRHHSSSSSVSIIILAGWSSSCTAATPATDASHTRLS